MRAHDRDLAARHVAGDDRVDADLFRRCPCAVWTVGHGSLPDRPRLAAAIDVPATETTQRTLDAAVLDTAFSLSTMFDAPLALVHAWRPFSDGRVAQHAAADDYASYAGQARRRAERALRTIVTAGPDEWRQLEPLLELRGGDPVDVIPAFVVSEGIDLLVVRSSLRTGFGWHLRGRTAEGVLNRVTCSVLAVKPAADAVQASHAPPGNVTMIGTRRTS